MDHPGALGHAADNEAVPLRHGGLGAAVGREDRASGRLPTLGGQLDRGQASLDLVDGKRRADDAGRKQEHLLGV